MEPKKLNGRQTFSFANSKRSFLALATSSVGPRITTLSLVVPDEGKRISTPPHSSLTDRISWPPFPSRWLCRAWGMSTVISSIWTWDGKFLDRFVQILWRFSNPGFFKEPSDVYCIVYRLSLMCHTSVVSFLCPNFSIIRKLNVLIPPNHALENKFWTSAGGSTCWQPSSMLRMKDFICMQNSLNNTMIKRWCEKKYKQMHSYHFLVQLLQIEIAFVDVVFWTTQRYHVALSAGIRNANHDVREALPDFPNFSALRADDLPVEPVIDEDVSRLFILLKSQFMECTNCT